MSIGLHSPDGHKEIPIVHTPRIEGDLSDAGIPVATSGDKLHSFYNLTQ
jgi:hypothetical protein